MKACADFAEVGEGHEGRGFARVSVLLGYLAICVCHSLFPLSPAFMDLYHCSRSIPGERLCWAKDTSQIPV